MKDKKVTILGAGISGLATAHWLEKDGYDVTILEQNSEAGGAMQTKLLMISSSILVLTAVWKLRRKLRK